MLLLPELIFELPTWSEKSFSTIKDKTRIMGEIAKNAEAGSDRFKLACIRIKRAFQRSDEIRFSQLFIKRIDVRAFTYLLTADKGFAQNILIDKPLLDQLALVNVPLSKLSLLQLIRAYLVHFDKITTEPDLVYWSDFINTQLSTFRNDSHSNELTRFAENSSWLFSSSGPAKLVANAQTNKIDLDTYLKKIGLTGYADSRYITLARYQYYLKQLELLPVGQDSELLAELVKRDVVNAPYEGSQLLGHAILKLMIDRSEGQMLSDSWQRVILSVAGDPRVPKSSHNYQKWWSLLGEKRISLVRGWLSRFDLSLFLKVLEQSAKDGNNEDMERMFTPRKTFMQGLEKSGLITESRLFLSNYAESYLKQHYKKEELPNYAKALSQQTSMIYLNIGNKVHMIEGSHSFTLKLMDRIPTACKVNDYSNNRISNDEFRTQVGHQYRQEFSGPGIIELRHDQHLNWQNNAVNFLATNKINVDIADIIDKKQYRTYKQKFGA